MNKVFKPIINTIIIIVAYSLLGALLYLELLNSAFIIAGVIISILMLQAYIIYLKKFDSATKSQHLFFLIASLAVLLLMLAYCSLAIKRSDYFLLFLSLASLPPFYNFCGYTRFTKVDEKTSLLEYVIGIMMAPFLAFLVYNHFSGTNYKTIYIIVIVAAYYFVLFSLIKIAAMVIKEKNLINNFFKNPKSYRILTVFIMLVMPLTGLLLNQYMYSYVSQYARQTLGYYLRHNSDGFFGDFSHPVFYLLAVLNAILLLIPEEKYQKFKLPMFYAKSLGYCFIVYMFIVFLPVLPVGVLALFFIVGIYAFVPLTAAWWQGKILLAEYRALKAEHGRNLAAGIFLIGFLTLPIILSAFFSYDKANYNKALAYADEYNADTSKKVDIPALGRTLGVRNANTYMTWLYGSKIQANYSYKNIPLISGIYKQYIYKGRELSWQYQDRLNDLFLNDNYSNYYYDDIYNYDYYYSDSELLEYYTENRSDVHILEAAHTTHYDEGIQAYRTWIDLTLENSMVEGSEYRTKFHIPDGVYVSDYYLDVNGEKKMGLLADRRAALAVYTSIVLSRLDPGILHYVDDNLLELRVFPFSIYERRTTGFEVIHKNSFDLQLDDHLIEISAGERVSEDRLPGAVLLSSSEIKDLPPLERAPEYSFIMDCSAKSDMGYLTRLINNYCRQNNIDDATVYLTTYRYEKIPLKDLSKADIEQEGGFNLGLAMKDALKSANDAATPIIIFVSNASDDNLTFPVGANDYETPESLYYYRLATDVYGEAVLTAYSFSANARMGVLPEPKLLDAVSYNGRAVINDGEDKLVILEGEIPEPTGNQYLDAIAMAAEYKINMKNGIKNPLSYIQKSFNSHSLTPSTAFIVVETKTQEEQLLEMQKNILDAQASDDNRNLSEPNIIVLVAAALIMFLLLCLIEKRRRFRRRCL